MNIDNGIIGEDTFLFGSSTAPSPRGLDWPQSEWASDMQHMKELNLNVVRVWAPWDRIELKEDEYDFSVQDFLFKTAREKGIKVILNFGGVFDSLCACNPPRYLYETGRVTLTKGSPSAAPSSPASSLSATACPDDPYYRERAFKFMRITVERYKNEPSLIGWMIWNEPASHFCYCEHTLRAFRKYLSEHYEFNEFIKKLSCEFPVTYKSWDEIPAPTGGWVQPLWYPWVRFHQERLCKNMQEIRQLVEKIDGTRRFTTSNVVYHLAAMEGPMNAPHYGMHLANVGGTMSLQGLSCYSIEHMYDVYPAYTLSYKLSRIRSVSRDPDRRMVVLETGAGGNLRSHSPKTRTLLFWQQIANNVKGILMFHYRSRLSGTFAGLFSMMKWNGEPTERALEIGRVSGLLQKYARLFNTSYPDRQAAVWTPEETQNLMDPICGNAFGLMEYAKCHDSRFGAYKLFWDLHIPADCIAENNFNEMNKYKVILVPMQHHILPEYARLFRAYVENGGTLIVESPFGYLNEDGLLFSEAPGYGMKELFGAVTGDVDRSSNASPAKFSDGKESPAYTVFCEYETAPEAEVIAAYANGTAAVIRKRTGKGMTLLLSTDVFRQYAEKPDQVMADFLKSEIMKTGVVPAIRMTGNDDNVEGQRLSGKNGVVYMILNHADEPRKLHCTLQEKDGDFTDIVTGKKYPGTFDLELQGKEPLILVRM